MRQCATACKRQRARAKEQASAARQKLRDRIALARVKAREVCKVCKVNARGEGLDRIDTAIAELGLERQNIAELRAAAGGMKSERGRAGGRRAAELRDQSDSEVRNNLGDDDAIMLALWDRTKRKHKASKYRSRTEAFVEHVAEHPEEYAEQTQRMEAQWALEAEQHYAELEAVKVGELDDDELVAYRQQLETADDWVDQAAVPF